MQTIESVPNIQS